jgi:hypothetical protein
MLKRFWLVICLFWAVAFLGNGMTKEGGIRSGDVTIALLPGIIGVVLWRAGRFVVSGR